jgi:hypothetical protein
VSEQAIRRFVRWYAFVVVGVLDWLMLVALVHVLLRDTI